MKNLPEVQYHENTPNIMESVKGRLRKYGVVVVRNLPLDCECEALVSFAEALGSVSKHGIGPLSNQQRPEVHRIEPLKEVRLDRYGNRVLSTTADAMACHTDDSFSEEPVAGVLLHCAIKGDGGETILARLNELLLDLPEEVIATLEEHLFPAPTGWRPILTRSRKEIRFSAYEIEKMVAGGMPLRARGKEAVGALNISLKRVSKTHSLLPGDCIVIDNKRVLHGRYAFRSEKPRLLFRIRLDSLSPSEGA